MWYLSTRPAPTTIQQTAASSREFDPNNKEKNIKIDNTLYTMELPAEWKEIAVNRDTRYNSTQWQMQSGGKNRWIELFTDKLPPEMSFNKIIPVEIKGREIEVGTISDNCAKFTPFISQYNLKVASKWQDANFLCDLSNKTDNIIGVSDKTTGTALVLTGSTKGKHTYMFVYTDRGIPEDNQPLLTALQSLSPK